VGFGDSGGTAGVGCPGSAGAVGGRCGASAMVCHSEEYHGALVAGFVVSSPGCGDAAAAGGSWT
jgi:hypothetical protein